MIFARRWHGIKGETIGAGTPHAIEVVRIQLEKDGPWQSLTDKELEQLLIEHNQIHGAGTRKVETVDFSSKRIEAVVKTIPSPTKKKVAKIDAGQRGAMKEAAAARKSMIPKAAKKKAKKK